MRGAPTRGRCRARRGGRTWTTRPPTSPRRRTCPPQSGAWRPYAFLPASAALRPRPSTCSVRGAGGMLCAVEGCLPLSHLFTPTPIPSADVWDFVLTRCAAPAFAFIAHGSGGFPTMELFRQRAESALGKVSTAGAAVPTPPLPPQSTRRPLPPPRPAELIGATCVPSLRAARADGVRLLCGRGDLEGPRRLGGSPNVLGVPLHAVELLAGPTRRDAVRARSADARRERGHHGPQPCASRRAGPHAGVHRP